MVTLSHLLLNFTAQEHKANQIMCFNNHSIDTQRQTDRQTDRQGAKNSGTLRDSQTHREVKRQHIKSKKKLENQKQDLKQISNETERDHSN